MLFRRDLLFWTQVLYQRRAKRHARGWCSPIALPQELSIISAKGWWKSLDNQWRILEYMATSDNSGSPFSL